MLCWAQLSDLYVQGLPTLLKLHGPTASRRIALESHTFDRTERDAAVLGSLETAELLEFYRTARWSSGAVARTYIAPGAPRRACVVTAVVPKLGDDADGLQKALEKLAVTTAPWHCCSPEILEVRDELSFRSARQTCAKRA